jgi:hypothetical protein
MVGAMVWLIAVMGGLAINCHAESVHCEPAHITT